MLNEPIYGGCTRYRMICVRRRKMSVALEDVVLAVQTVTELIANYIRHEWVMANCGWC